MGIAVKNARQFIETKQKLERIRAVSGINLAITSTLDLRHALDLLLEKSGSILPYASATVRVYDKQRRILEPIACRSLDETEWKSEKWISGRGLSNLVFETASPVVVRNVQTDPRTKDQGFFRKNGLVSYVGLPLIVKDEVLGVLAFCSKEIHEFIPEEMEFFTTLAGHAAIAIQNAKLYDQTKKQAVELERANQDLQRHGEIQELLKEINQDITSLDLDTLLKKLTEKVREILKVDVADVRVRTNEILQVMGVAGIHPQLLEPTSTTARGRSQWIINNRKPLIISDIEQQKDPLTGSVLSGLGLRGYLGIGLFSKGGEVIGIIRALSYAPRNFTHDEVDLLQQLANGAAIALENARLVEEINNSKAELENANRTLTLQAAELTRSNKEVHARYRELLILKTLSETILGSVDLQSVTSNILEQAMLSGFFDLGNVRLLDSGGDILEIVASRGYRDPQNILRHRELSRIGEGAPSRFGDRIFMGPCMEEHVQTAPGLRTLKKEGVESFIEVPIRADAKVLGIIQLASRSPRKLKAEEISLLETIGNQIGAAVQKAQLYEETQRQARELEKASKLQADFTAMMIHDLRSPIMNMMGAAEAIADGVFGPVNEDQRKWLLKLLASGHSVVDLVSDYLDLSKVEAGHIEITKEKVDLGKVIENSIENYLPLVRDRRISFIGAVPAAFPNVMADSRRLNQVLSNLLGNAVKFSEDGGRIEVGADYVNGTEIKIWVKDNGVGIASEEIGGLFEKYRQLTSGKISEYKGTGLGLVICKTIVEAHGGRIWVESEEKKGATFFFTLADVKTMCGD